MDNYSDTSESLRYKEEDFDAVPFLNSDQLNRRHLTPARRTFPWIVATVVFATLSILQLFFLVFSKHSSEFRTGFPTDLKKFTPLLETQQVQFTGGLKFDENGVLYRSIDESQPQYVGTPSMEIDQAWENSFRNRILTLDGSNGEVIANSYQDPDTGEYRVGVDTFHTLHCLNQLRMEIDKDYYHPGKSEGPTHHRLHIEHCLDYIRQVLQCYTDLTPLPVVWSESANRTYVDFEVTHTCRNFKKVREWATDHIGETLEP